MTRANMTLALMFGLTILGGMLLTCQLETQSPPTKEESASAFNLVASWLWSSPTWRIRSSPKTVILTSKRTASHENMFWFEFDGPTEELEQWRLESLWFSVGNSSNCLAMHPFWHRDGQFDTLERFRYWRHYLRLTLKPSGKYSGPDQRLISTAFELNIPNHSLLCSFCSSPWLTIDAELTQSPSFDTRRTISHHIRIVH